MAIDTISKNELEFDLRSQITHMLRMAMLEWQDLPSVYEEFPEMETFEQMEFLAEWNKADERLWLLNQLYDGGEMNRDQVMLYNRLYESISENSPLINQLKEYSGMTEAFSLGSRAS